MAELPPITRDQRKVDVDQLNLLAIFHFVGAGLALVGLLFLGLHFLMFMTFMANAPDPRGNRLPPAEFFMFFRFFYVIAAAFFVSSGVLNIMSGLFLRSRTHRMFSIVVAAINCMHMPIGTVLGAFTIVVLARDSVRELYDVQASVQKPYGVD
jgi:hypothetical protein